MMRRWHNQHGQRGAVSLFIVIFTALLVTTITVGFVRVMIQDQEQATASDLSKSAMDSAQAGVEDAKRAIVTYREYCLGGGASGTTECANLARALTPIGDAKMTECDTIQRSGIAGNPDSKEVLIEQNEGDSLLQQAYTCVKVQLNTSDYIGSLAANASRLIPLKTTAPFNEITIQWYSQRDLQSAAGNDVGGDLGKIDLGLDAVLPREWPKNRPALLRTQLIQFGDSFNLSDFDKNVDDTTNAATLFLMPSSVGLEAASFGDDIRQSQVSDVLKQVRCEQDFSTTSIGSPYACKVVIKLPNPIGEDDANNRTAYLRLSAFYNENTSFSITLGNSGTYPILFSGVQPLIDSTGRANDLFRRIQSRIELESSSTPYIEAAVDVTGSLCKTFRVTDNERGYDAGTCEE